MSNLILKVPATKGVPAGTPIWTEVFDSRMEFLQRLVITAGEPEVLDLKPGSYSILAFLPSGKRAAAVAPVKHGADCTVEIIPPGQVTPDRPEGWHPPREFRPKPHDVAILPGWKQPLDVYPLRSDVWFRVWQRENGAWAVWPDFPTKRSLGRRHVSLTIEAPKQGLLAVQFGGEEARWRNVVIPPLGRAIELRVRHSDSMKPSLEVTIALTEKDLTRKALLAYMSSGNLQAVKSLSERMVQRAIKDLHDKKENPVAATLGGYCLLQTGTSHHFSEWFKNLTDWFPWLPDGPIIQAWQILRDEKAPNIKMARELLLESRIRGNPLCRDGVRYLYDGLKLFQRESSRRMFADPEVDAALADTEVFALALDWSAFWTTYFGVSPNEPSPTAIRGIPKDRRGLFFLGRPDDPPKEMGRLRAA